LFASQMSNVHATPLATPGFGTARMIHSFLPLREQIVTTPSARSPVRSSCQSEAYAPHRSHNVRTSAGNTDRRPTASALRITRTMK
jgi:hypothetical protein